MSPARSSPACGVCHVPSRRPRVGLALRNHDGNGVQRTNEGSPARWRLKEATNFGGLLLLLRVKRRFLRPQICDHRH